MKSKSLLALLLALALCLGLAACGNKGNSNSAGDPGEQENQGTDDQQQPETPEEPEETFPTAPIGTELGSGMEDFTFTDYNGVSHSLYETLKEKKMVLINIWATWCSPCRSEFPYMEMAYEDYKDDIEIFALSCESEDTNEVIAGFAEEMGLTFLMGQETAGLSDIYASDGIPTSLVVDRFGNICFLESGSITSAETFARLFETFVADDYAESQVLANGVPQQLPDVEPTDPADLAAALGEGITCSNPDDEYNWPMIVEDDHITASNTGVDGSVSSVDVQVTAAAGDVFAVDYRASTEASYDYMCIYVDGEMVKGFSGERDWSPYGYRFEAEGTYTVTLAYEKDEASSDGDDTVSFRNARVLSGSDADALLASMPSYPHAEETTFTVTTPGAREVVLTGDPTGCKWYIIPDDTVTFSATLAEGVDAECSYFFTCFDGSFPALSDCVVGDHYEFTSGIDTYGATGYTYSYADLVPFGGDPAEIYFVRDEENLNTVILENFTEDDGSISGSWRYADGSAPETTAVCEDAGLLAEGSSLYYLVFTDQNGEPVEGIMANVCDDATCTQMTSDENGIVAFALPSFEYHIQVIKVPEGYEYDTSAETYVSAEGGVTEFAVTKG